MVVRFLMSLPAPSVLLGRYMSPEAVRGVWLLAWVLAMGVCGGVAWFALMRLVLAVYHPRPGGRADLVYGVSFALAAGGAAMLGAALKPVMLPGD